MSFAATIISFCSGLTDSCCRFLRQCPSELLCLCISYAIYLYTGDIAWAYYGIPVILLNIGIRRKLFYSLFPVIYIIYMYLVSIQGFGAAVFASSLMSALGVLLYYLKRYNSYPAWAMVMFGIAAGYKAAISAVLLNVLLLLTAFSGVISEINHSVRQILGFSAFVVFPIAVIYSLRIIRNFTLKIPTIIRWIHMIFVESITVVLASTLLISAVQITLMARIPKPYVVYIAVAFILVCEFVNMLHSQSPRTWYNAFFRYRNVIYIPILLMGCASLYVEFSIVGLLPRTFVVSVCVLWLLLMSAFRMFSGCAGIFSARNHALFFLILFIGTFFLTFFIT